MSSEHTIAICIATYRRRLLLSRLLHGIAELSVPSGYRIEVRIVENDAEERARDQVHEWTARTGITTRYAVQPERNIALTRNRALDMGAADWFAFIDDDEVPATDWLERLLDVARQQHSDAVFGNVVPELPPDAPQWLTDGGYLHKRVEPSLGDDLWQGARTANALVRGHWLHQRRFRVDYGRSGGEDTELFRRMVMAGAKLGWAPDARAREAIRPEQCGLPWLYRRHYRSGRVYERILGREPIVSLGVAARRAGLALFRLILAAGPALAGRQARFVRACLDIAKAAGAARQAFAFKTYDPKAGYQSAGCER